MGAATPFDVAQQLPVGEYTPRASATASITVTDSPVGDFEFHDVFVDGQLSARIGGPSPTPPDMTITISFAAMTSPPSTSVLEMIENAQMNSPTTNALMLVAGLYDCPSVREAMGGRAGRSTTCWLNWPFIDRHRAFASA
ncbi:MAG: hypothetical protein H6512_07700 [Acidimicrobiia bacterium]|nr:hypothetical protein [Acidimicrobiia bacterium]